MATASAVENFGSTVTICASRMMKSAGVASAVEELSAAIVSMRERIMGCVLLEGEADAETEEAADDIVELAVGAAFVDSAGGAGRNHRRILVEEVVDGGEQLDRAATPEMEAVTRRRVEVEECRDRVAVDRVRPGAFVEDRTELARSDEPRLQPEMQRSSIIV